MIKFAESQVLFTEPDPRTYHVLVNLVFMGDGFSLQHLSRAIPPPLR